MAFDLQDVVNDPDLAEPFTITRSSGQFAAGGWTSASTTIQAFGVVTVAGAKQLDMIPEADRVHGSRVFICEQPMYVTSETRQDGQSGTSDILVWNDVKYRVHSVGNYNNRGGFYFAVATRMAGQ